MFFCKVGVVFIFVCVVDDDYVNGENYFNDRNDMDVVDSYVKCMKILICLFCNYCWELLKY